MQLSSIEKVVLNNIGMRYDELSVSTDTKEILDFAMLHTCINLAREEIKLNTTIPSILKRTGATATTASTKAYSLPTDFDIPLKVFYTQDSDEFELDQVYPANLLEKLNNTTAEGTPGFYMILGQSTALVQIEFYDTPLKAGSYKVIYKPVLAELSATTDEDVIMKKYPKTTIDFATAIAFQILKKDSAQHDKYYTLGLSECSKIDARETRADSSFKELPDSLTRSRRAARITR